MYRVPLYGSTSLKCGVLFSAFVTQNNPAKSSGFLSNLVASSTPDEPVNPQIQESDLVSESKESSTVTKAHGV